MLLESYTNEVASSGGHQKDLLRFISDERGKRTEKFKIISKKALTRLEIDANMNKLTHVSESASGFDQRNRRFLISRIRPSNGSSK